MYDVFSQTWPWFVSGPLIAMVMLALLYLGGQFGVSSTLRVMCSAAGGNKLNDYFRWDWKSQTWNLVFVLGAIIGGFLATSLLNGHEVSEISVKTQNALAHHDIIFDHSLAPASLFSWSSLNQSSSLICLCLGGFLIGFGTRWAGGCTSGHAISGLSNLQWPSLVAVIGFFTGGLLATHLLFHLIF